MLYILVILGWSDENFTFYNCCVLTEIDGLYTPWSEWAPCSDTSGNGVQIRSRSCTAPPPRKSGKNCSQYGPPVEHRDCKTIACPVLWGEEETTELNYGNIGKFPTREKVNIFHCSWGNLKLNERNDLSKRFQGDNGIRTHDLRDTSAFLYELSSGPLRCFGEQKKIINLNVPPGSIFFLAFF